MNKETVQAVVSCDTVGDLLNKLSRIAKDPDSSDLLDAAIEGTGGRTFLGFRMIRRTLSDKSTVLDFELFGAETEDA